MSDEGDLRRHEADWGPDATLDHDESGQPKVSVSGLSDPTLEYEDGQVKGTWGPFSFKGDLSRLPVSEKDSGKGETKEPPSGYAQAPRGLGDKENSTADWDLSTLEKVARFLQSESDFLRRKRTQMEGVAELMRLDVDGNPKASHASPLGTFDGAQTLNRRHNLAYQAVRNGLKQICDDLDTAATATRRIHENYRTVEEWNRLSVQELSRIFAEAAEDRQSGQSGAPNA